MIKKLKKKFVLTSMFSLTILLVILIFTITTISYINIENAMDTTLEKMMRSPYDNVPKGEKEQRPTFGYSIESPQDFRQSSFMVYAITYPTGTEITVKEDHMKIYNIDMEEIEECVDIVIKSEETTGKVNSYKYMKGSFGQSGTKIAFIDASVQIQMLTNIIKISCFAALGLLLIMFIIVYMLSSKAVKPFAENMNKQKEFITNAGHEIKTPLAIITANADAWELNPQNKKYIINIKEQIKRLEILTNQLSLLAKSDEHSGGIMKKDIDFSDIVRKSADNFTPLLENQIFAENIKDNIYINADIIQIQEVINILLDNAVKYSSENSNINISLDKKGDSALLKISNRTDSIPDVSAETLFERFYRFDASHNSKTGGSGIGLSIAKEFVEANGGSINAEFAKNNEVIFTVTFKAK